MVRQWLHRAMAAITIASSLASAQEPALPPLNADSNVVRKPAPPGENAALDSMRAKNGESLRVSLITYGPTDVVWERFGHDAIAIRDTITGQDIVYNWGEFDFEQPNFYKRFLTGETSYWISAYPTPDFNAVYVRQNRSIRVQQLAMTAVQKAALLELVSWNLLEANKYYRYDYYRDNCATRVRDALDHVLNGRVKLSLDTGVTSLTWRSETERVTASNYPVYAGIELALGRNADTPLTNWGASFMPERLADAAATIILKNADGQRYSLVSSDSVVFASSRVPMPIDPPDRTVMAALLGLAIAGIIALLADAESKFLRGVLVGFATLWYLIGGILGTALLLAGTATKHIPYMGSNTTLWQIHPLLLFAALFLPVAFRRREATQTPRILAALIALFSVFGALLQLVPMYRQHSGVVLAVMVPIHLALAIGLLRLPIGTPRRRFSAAPAAVPRAS
ncbi:MAG: DUF4105 domain-containing protein [Gemmatimonadaceae bacterium]